MGCFNFFSRTQIGRFMRTDLPATWFRLYAEFATDPKVQMLSEADQRRFLMIMCLRCCNGSVTLQDSEVAFQLRISEAEYTTTKNTLFEKGLIKSDNTPTKWESRQFDSDTSNARVAKHRALQKEKQQNKSNAAVTLPKQKSNAPETETETETEKKKGPAGLVFPAWIPMEAWNGYSEMRKKIKKPMTERAMELKFKELKKFKDAGHDITVILDKSTENSWTDLYEPKPGQKIIRKQDWSSKPDWVMQAGFTDIADANASMCWQHNAHQFHNGKRAEAAAA